MSVDIVEYFNANSGFSTIVSSIIVGIITLAYVILTYYLLKENREMRSAQTDPVIVVTVSPRDEWIGFIDLIIANVGQGAAHEISLKVEPDFEYEPGRNLSSLGFFKNGIPLMLPDQKYQFYLTRMDDSYDQKIAKKLKVTSIYKDGKDRLGSHISVIDFSQFEGIRQFGKAPIRAIEEHLRKITDSIDTIASGKSMIEVRVVTAEDIENRKKEDELVHEELRQELRDIKKKEGH